MIQIGNTGKKKVAETNRSDERLLEKQRCEKMLLKIY